MAKPDMLWVSHDDRVSRISDLDSRHLLNVINHTANLAKVEAIHTLVEYERVGAVPPSSFDWQDYLPRYYDHLVFEYTLRGRRVTFDNVSGPSQTWIDRWLSPEDAAVVLDWYRRHPAPSGVR